MNGGLTPAASDADPEALPPDPPDEDRARLENRPSKVPLPGRGQ